MREVAAPDSGQDRRRAPGGMPTVLAVLLLLALSIAGSVFDLRVNHTLGTPFDVAFVFVSLLAVLVVRLGGIVVTMFAPPIVLIVAATVGVLADHGLQGGSTAVVLAIATPVLPQFPVMAGTTAATLIIGTIRLLRRRHRDKAASGRAEAANLS